MNFVELANQALVRLRTTEEPVRKEITVEDVLRVFPGAKVIDIKKHAREKQFLRCIHCGFEMAERLERNRHLLTCRRCGKKTR